MTGFSRRDLFKRMGAVGAAALVGYSSKADAAQAVEDQGWTPLPRADYFIDHQGREFLMVQMDRDVAEGDLVSYGTRGKELGVALAAAPKGHFAFVQVRGPAQVRAVAVGGGGATALPLDPEVRGVLAWNRAGHRVPWPPDGRD